MLPNLICVLIKLLAKCVVEDVLKAAVLKTVIFAEKYPWQSLLLRKLQCVELQLF